MRQFGHFIGNNWRAASGGKRIERADPARGDIVASFAAARPYKFLAISDRDATDLLAEAAQRLSPRLACARSHSNYLEIGPASVSKGAALRRRFPRSAPDMSMPFQQGRGRMSASSLPGLTSFIARRLALSGLLIALLLLVLIAALISDAFLNPFNIVNVLRQVALYGIVSIGITFVILTAGIDLSVGSIVAVVAVVTAMMLNAAAPVLLVILGALAIGAAFGFLNGLGITLIGIPPFIMTLGAMVMLRGLALTISDGRPIDVTFTAVDFSWLGRGDLLSVPVAVWIFAAVVAISLFVLRYTAFGRAVYAVGSNAEAVRLSGINVSRVLVAVYAISGMLAALTSIIFVSRLTVGEPTAGTGLELEAIAIAVIGGASLFGGQGGVVGTVIGAAILAVLATS